MRYSLKEAFHELYEEDDILTEEDLPEGLAGDLAKGGKDIAKNKIASLVQKSKDPKSQEKLYGIVKKLHGMGMKQLFGMDLDKVMKDIESQGGADSEEDFGDFAAFLKKKMGSAQE